jgi:hypothetical protein
LLAFDSSWDFGLQSIVVLLPYIGPVFSRSRSRGERYQVDKILKVTKREHLLSVERHRAVTVLLSPIPIVLMLTYVLVAAMLKTLHLTSKREEGDFCGHSPLRTDRSECVAGACKSGSSFERKKGAVSQIDGTAKTLFMNAPDHRPEFFSIGLVRLCVQSLGVERQ